MHLQFYQLSLIGDRAHNEDSMARVLTEQYALCVVADGLGGHNGGEKASQYFCQCMLSLAPQYVHQMTHAAQATLTAWVDEAISSMMPLFGDYSTARSAHTTCAILYLDPQQVVTAHCGDSRIYCLNAQQILWRTQDHSLLQQKLDCGELSELEGQQHPSRHKLTRTINVLKQNCVEIGLHLPAQPGDTFILCSDGFWSAIRPEEWLEMSQAESDRSNLIEISNALVYRSGGKSDNITVQWLRCL